MVYIYKKKEFLLIVLKRAFFRSCYQGWVASDIISLSFILVNKRTKISKIFVRNFQGKTTEHLFTAFL